MSFNFRIPQKDVYNTRSGGGGPVPASSNNNNNSISGNNFRSAINFIDTKINKYDTRQNFIKYQLAEGLAVLSKFEAGQVMSSYGKNIDQVANNLPCGSSLQDICYAFITQMYGKKEVCTDLPGWIDKLVLKLDSMAKEKDQQALSSVQASSNNNNNNNNNNNSISNNNFRSAINFINTKIEKHAKNTPLITYKLAEALALLSKFEVEKVIASYGKNINHISCRLPQGSSLQDICYEFITTMYNCEAFANLPGWIDKLVSKLDFMAQEKDQQVLIAEQSRQESAQIQQKMFTNSAVSNPDVQRIAREKAELARQKQQFEQDQQLRQQEAAQKTIALQRALKEAEALKAEVEKLKQQQAASAPAATSNADENECVVCMDKPKAQIAIIPCGHIPCCIECITKLKDCAMCRGPIEKTIKLFQN